MAFDNLKAVWDRHVVYATHVSAQTPSTLQSAQIMQCEAMQHNTIVEAAAVPTHAVVDACHRVSLQHV